MSHRVRDEGLRRSCSVLQINQEFNGLLTTDDDCIVREVKLMETVELCLHDLPQSLWLVREQRVGSHPLQGGGYSGGELVRLPENAFGVKVLNHLLVQAFQLPCCFDTPLPASNGIVVAEHGPTELVVNSLRAPELEHGPEDADDHGLLRPREAGN